MRATSRDGLWGRHKTSSAPGSMSSSAWCVAQDVLLNGGCGEQGVGGSDNVIMLTVEFGFLNVSFLSSDGLWHLS